MEAALKVDVVNKTIAHYKQRTIFVRVDFVLDIGGQDMKCCN